MKSYLKSKLIHVSKAPYQAIYLLGTAKANELYNVQGTYYRDASKVSTLSNDGAQIENESTE